jgi:hypothetical protein
MSARAYHRILKLARTNVDLTESDGVQSLHFAEVLHHHPMLNLRFSLDDTQYFGMLFLQLRPDKTVFYND